MRRIVAGGLALLAVLGGVILIIDQPINSGSLLMLAALVFVGVGTLVVVRSNNRIGWVVSLIGIALIGAGVTEFWTRRGYVAAGAIGGTLWFSWFVLAGFLLLWFPTGRVPSRHWRFVEGLGFLGIVVAVSYAFSAQVCTNSSDNGPCLTWVDNPIGISWVPNPEFGPLGGLNYAVLGGFVLLSLAAIVFRFVRSRGVERLQLKWMLTSGICLVALGFLEEAIDLPLWVDDTLFAAGVAALPVSMGVAVLKYRLYDIDRIISRTLSYALVVVSLALVYITVAVWLPTRLTGEQSPIFVAGATLLAAALFNPLRRRIVHGIDRRFHRSRYDSDLVMSDFAGRLREQVDMDRLTSDWLGVVIRTMSPATAGVWMRER